MIKKIKKFISELDWTDRFLLFGASAVLFSTYIGFTILIMMELSLLPAAILWLFLTGLYSMLIGVGMC